MLQLTNQIAWQPSPSRRSWRTVWRDAYHDAIFISDLDFRGKAKPYRDLIKSVAGEEIGQVELISTTINMLLDASTPSSPPNELPLSPALNAGNIHHYLVGAQSAKPVDSVGNPWSGSYVYNNGILVLDLLYNLMLECTGGYWRVRTK